MVSVISDDSKAVIKKYLSAKRHTKTVKQSFQAIPQIGSAMREVFEAAPYLIFVYIVIAWIDIQYRLTGPPEIETAVFSIMLTLALTTVANGLVYIETYNTHTTRERVPNTGRYVLKKTITLTATLLTSALLIFSGLFLFVIPGIYLAVRFALAGPACIIENMGVRESLAQSMRATKEKTLFTYITLGNAGVIITISLLLFINTSGLFEIVFVLLAYGILPPIIHALLALLYLNASNGNRVQFYGKKRDLTTRKTRNNSFDDVSKCGESD